MLFSEVRGLPVLVADGSGPIGSVTSLTVDVASGAVSHVRLRDGAFGWFGGFGRFARFGRFRRERALPWDAVDTVGPGAVRLRTAAAVEPAPPSHHELLGHRVLVETGTGHGTVLDVAFDTGTARVLALFTTRGEVPADRLLGLGDWALVVRAG